MIIKKKCITRVKASLRLPYEHKTMAFYELFSSKPSGQSNAGRLAILIHEHRGGSNIFKEISTSFARSDPDGLTGLSGFFRFSGTPARDAGGYPHFLAGERDSTSEVAESASDRFPILVVPPPSISV